jgi:hypothetical protein
VCHEDSNLRRVRAPAAWTWYRVYCGFFVTWNVALLAFGLWLVFGAFAIPEPLTREAVRHAGWTVATKGFLFAPLYVAIVRLPRCEWAYRLHAVNIWLGAALCVTVPFVIALALAWSKPHVRAFFGMAESR